MKTLPHSSRYVVFPRLSWCPVLYVVIDADTGSILSRHAKASDAKATAKAMNSARR